MAISSSGPISIQDIVNEFGGSIPHSLTEYYRGGPYVPNTPANAAIPTSGTIGMSSFYGTSRRIPIYVTIGSTGINYELLTLAQAVGYQAGISDIYVTINGGVVCGSSSISNYGLYIRSFTSGDTITLTQNGYILGKGGDAVSDGVGGNGGPALYVRYPTTIINNGIIGGGGGAGGSYNSGTGNADGGGGAGYYGGNGTGSSGAGSLTTGGSGVYVNQGYGSWIQGGTGGALGASGNPALGGYLDSSEPIRAGGSAGIAIDGNSYITWSTYGDVRGALIN